jgi:hypothetical protein
LDKEEEIGRNRGIMKRRWERDREGGIKRERKERRR